MLFLLVVFAGFYACDSDDDIIYFEPPSSATEGIEQDEIRLLIVPSTESDSLSFIVGFGNDRSKEVKINWGDDNRLHSYPGGQVKYKYADAAKEYIVTIQAPGIKSFDYSHQKSISKTKSLAFGNCPTLEILNASLLNNIYENFDLSQCPQFNETINFSTYTNRFNFNGLKNFKTLYLSCYNMMSVVEMKDMNFTRVRLVMVKDYDYRRIEKLYINNSRDDITSVEISCTYSDSHRVPTVIEDLTLDMIGAYHLDIDGIDVPDMLDLSRFRYLESLRILNSYYPGIKMPQNMQAVRLDNQWLTKGYINQGPETLDFSNCSDMKSIVLMNLKNLRTVNIEGLEKLTVMEMKGSPDAEIIGKLPESNTENEVTVVGSKTAGPTDEFMIRLRADR